MTDHHPSDDAVPESPETDTASAATEITTPETDTDTDAVAPEPLPDHTEAADTDDSDGAATDGAETEAAETEAAGPAEVAVEAADVVVEPDGFEVLGLRPELLRTLTALGYEEPTPIQAETIPPLLRGVDLLGQAATGTGKTAAFALPILQRITSGGSKPTPMALVLVPTHELAIQVSEAIWRYGKELGAKVVPLYGGQPIYRQLQALAAGVHVVVATPGRAIDHIKRGTLPLGEVRIVVLDEADEMLDMGFAEDIESILEETPKDRQTVLFSATMPPRIDAIARKHQRSPIRIQIARTSSATGESPLVRQSAYIVSRAHKAAALGRILDVEAPAAALVFCRTRIEVDQLTETLTARGYRAEALHGGMSQEQRDRVMGRLRNGHAELLIATDVTARGLDVDVLTHVVNYDVPSAPEAYVHRIGRVGRAGREGVAITLAEPREQRQLGNIERLTKQKIAIEKVPSVAELRARQMDLTIGSLRDALAGDDLDPFRTAVQALRSEFDNLDVAAAALKLAHELAGNATVESEIPDLSARVERTDRHRAERDSGERSTHSSGPTTKIYFGLGKLNNIRPGDLVGAIANETHLSGKEIGPIKVGDRFSLVGVPESAADEVIEAMRRATFKGKKTTVRRYTEDAGGASTRDARPSAAVKPWERTSGGKKQYGGPRR